MGCLIGEVARGFPSLEDVQQGLWQKFLIGNKVEVWQFKTGNFFIHGVSIAMYIKITGWMQKASGDREVKRCCILPTDRVSIEERGSVILEVQGIPMGYRSWPALEAMVRPFGMLC